MTKTFLKGALVAAVAFAATPAFAAATPFTAKAVILKTVTISKNADLDFGTTTLNPTLTNASVSVAAVASSTAVCSDTVMLSCSGGNEASFDVHGVGNVDVQLAYNAPATLDDGAGHSVAFTLDAPDAVTLADGEGTFYVGGTIDIDAATTQDGTYQGDLDVTASYE